MLNCQDFHRTNWNKFLVVTGDEAIKANGPFTLPENDTVADTENRYTEPNGNLCCHLSLCSVNNSTILYNPIFACLSIGLGVRQCKYTIKETKYHVTLEMTYSGGGGGVSKLSAVLNAGSSKRKAPIIIPEAAC